MNANFPAGKRRNIGLSCVGAGQPLGYTLGLFLGEFFADSIGWRWGWYLAAIVGALVGAAGWWSLPKDREGPVRWSNILYGIDWIGAIAASAGLGFVSFVLA